MEGNFYREIIYSDELNIDFPDGLKHKKIK